MKHDSFINAKPVFLENMKDEKNIFAGFYKSFSLNDISERALFHICARTYYRLFINGEFVMHGPARTAEGHGRVDVLDIRQHLKIGENYIAIEIMSYNTPELSLTGEFGYLICEMFCNNVSCLYSDSAWKGYLLDYKERNIERFSHARNLNEGYSLYQGYDKWRINAPLTNIKEHNISELDDKISFVERFAKLPCVSVIENPYLTGVNDVFYDECKKAPIFGHIESKEYLEEVAKAGMKRPAIEAYKYVEKPFTGSITKDSKYIIESDTKGVIISFDFRALSSAFVGLDIEVDADTEIDIVHGEKLNELGNINPRSTASDCVMRLCCNKGRIKFESFEAYSVRYVKLIVRGATQVKINKVYLRNYGYDNTYNCSFICSDGELNRIYTAASETLRACANDIFMDCPGRERSGFLCDSLFSARGEKMLFGTTGINHDFLENFALEPINEKELYIPSCYPSKRASYVDIPNWAMFLIVQLDEYYQMTGDSQLVKDLEGVVTRIFATFKPYELENGLLKNQPGWTFVDWSASNNAENIKGISVATNCLYSMALKSAARLYHNPSFSEKAENILSIFKENGLSPNEFTYGAGKMFADCGDFVDNKFIPGDMLSEANQYYCGLAGLMDEKIDVKRMLIEEYGRIPDTTPMNLSVGRANIFIGLMLRFDCLAKWGEIERLLNELRELYGTIIDMNYTTLWELNSAFNSVCHGFNANVGVLLMTHLLGIGIPNEVNREIIIRPALNFCSWAKGSVIVSEGVVTLSWSKTKDGIMISCCAPKGYAIKLVLPKEINSYNHIRLTTDNEDKDINDRCTNFTLNGSFEITATF